MTATIILMGEAGHNGAALTSNGEAQVKAASEKLLAQGYCPNTIISATSDRMLQTAAIVLECFKELSSEILHLSSHGLDKGFPLNAGFDAVIGCAAENTTINTTILVVAPDFHIQVMPICFGNRDTETPGLAECRVYHGNLSQKQGMRLIATLMP